MSKFYYKEFLRKAMKKYNVKDRELEACLNTDESETSNDFERIVRYAEEDNSYHKVWWSKQ